MIKHESKVEFPGSSFKNNFCKVIIKNVDDNKIERLIKFLTKQRIGK